MCRIAPKLPPDAARLVKSMLSFLPETRPSCAEALSTEYFRQKHGSRKASSFASGYVQVV
ncbi:unnamed protein product [Wuchereria bancrofti]|uniref:Protein kinase domain-containing protein n=1 Tax=Wuchereria bancrofti TaxID=6293 RepID=A0A3P7E4J7_WUCBA|nr:unnamed protein product [Wuchereria bancrofti]